MLKKNEKNENCHQVQMRAKKALGKQINLSYKTDGIIKTNVFLHIWQMWHEQNDFCLKFGLAFFIEATVEYVWQQ